MICSGSKGLLYEHGQENSASHEANLQGTALQLIMDTSKLDDIAKKLEEFHEQGLSIARATRKGFIPPRMQMSSMLRNGLIDPNELVVDQSVVHDQFGPGKIIEFTDAPHGRLAQVQFKTGRVKRVLVQTLTPTWENEH